MNTQIECAGWKQSSCDDGPGIRSVLFLQGCRKNCPGCHNKEQQKHGAGVFYKIDEIAGYILAHCRNKKITFSGGEPLEQKEALYELGSILKEKGFHICIYTGWEWSQIPEEILGLADIVKAGGYVEGKKNENLHYVGSSNQVMKRKNEHNQWEEIDLVA